MCPDRESTQWPFSLRDDAQPAEPHHSGQENSSEMKAVHLPREIGWTVAEEFLLFKGVVVEPAAAAAAAILRFCSVA